MSPWCGWKNSIIGSNNGFGIGGTGTTHLANINDMHRWIHAYKTVCFPAEMNAWTASECTWVCFWLVVLCHRFFYMVGYRPRRHSTKWEWNMKRKKRTTAPKTESSAKFREVRLALFSSLPFGKTFNELPSNMMPIQITQHLYMLAIKFFSFPVFVCASNFPRLSSLTWLYTNDFDFSGAQRSPTASEMKNKHYTPYKNIKRLEKKEWKNVWNLVPKYSFSEFEVRILLKGKNDFETIFFSFWPQTPISISEFVCQPIENDAINVHILCSSFGQKKTKLKILFFFEVD